MFAAGSVVGGGPAASAVICTPLSCIRSVSESHFSIRATENSSQSTGADGPQISLNLKVSSSCLKVSPLGKYTVHGCVFLSHTKSGVTDAVPSIFSLNLGFPD